MGSNSFSFIHVKSLSCTLLKAGIAYCVSALLLYHPQASPVSLCQKQDTKVGALWLKWPLMFLCTIQKIRQVSLQNFFFFPSQSPLPHSYNIHRHHSIDLFFKYFSFQITVKFKSVSEDRLYLSATSQWLKLISSVYRVVQCSSCLAFQQSIFQKHQQKITVLLDYLRP